MEQKEATVPEGYVKIDMPRAPGGFGLLARRDFDPKVHKLFEEKKAPAAPPAGDKKPDETKK